VPRSTLALAIVLVLVPASSRAWRTTVTGTPDPSRPNAVAIDGAGDVLVAGRGGNDGVVAKLDGLDGGVLWQRTVAGTATAIDQLRAVARTANDAVVVAGQVMNAGTLGDAVVAKFASDGTPLWRVETDGGGNDEDDALAVAVDGSNDVIFAGQTTLPAETATHFSVAKRAGSSGASTWHVELTGTPGTARAVLVSGSDVYATGGLAGSMVVVKLADANGAQTWRTDVAGSAVKADTARAIAVGGGRVVVAGRMVTESGGIDFAIVALDAGSGAELWRYVLDGSATGSADTDDANGVAIDAAGDVVAVGVLSNADTDDDIAIVKLAGETGAEIWRDTINGGNSNNDDAQAVGLDATGDAFVVGSIRYGGGGGRDLFVGKFAGATGAERWRLELNGSSNGGDFGAVVAVGAAGDPVAAGRVRDVGVLDELVVLKRTGANNGDFPCGDGKLDPGEACDDGNVVAGDGCRADCTLEVCGDGILDPQEACDDGNTIDGDCCSSSCAQEPAGSPCDDGNACTLDDACANGHCTPSSSVQCSTDDACELASCDPATGACSKTRKANGAPCDDGNACTILERCIDDVCGNGFSPTCDDDDPCTFDHCDPASGCAADPLTGFDGVRCVFARDAIRPVCATLPGSVDAALARTQRLLDRGADADKPRRAKKSLKAAIKSMQAGARATEKQRKRNKVTAECADALERTFSELLTRAQGLRDTLVSPR